LTMQVRGPVVERKIINFAKDRVPLHSIERVVQIMIMGGRLKVVKQDFRTGQRFFKAEVPDVDEDGSLA